MIEWRPIGETEGLYEVSSAGDVRRAENKRILKSFLNHKGYPNVVMHKDGKPISSTVHRLVAKAFIPNPDQLPQVNHIDLNKQNNAVSNLEWITNDGNMHHAVMNGCFKRFSDKQYESVMRNITKAQGWNIRPVLCFSENGSLREEYESISEASRQTGCDDSKIVMCCKGKRKTTGGFMWKYKEEIDE